MFYSYPKSILSAKNGMNLCRGCLHGCIYCDSRSVCYQINHDFEDIEIKINANELLKDALSKRRNRGMIATGAMSDPYIPIKESLELTRSCLETIYSFGFGATFQTKSHLVLRDLDLMKKINAKSKAVLQMTLTTYDDRLCKILEPNVCVTSKRAEVLNIFRDNGIPTVVWLCPILPFINDTLDNLKGILNYCLEAKVKGILCFGFGLTLREGNREYFYQKLDESFPGMKQKYMRYFGDSYECNSPNNDMLMKYFTDFCKEHGIMYTSHDIFSYLHEFPSDEGYEQLSLF